MAAAQPDFSGPLMGPDFAQAVGAERDDAQVTVVRRGGEAVGFLAYHRRPGGLARAIGAPLADYHGLVSAAGEAIDIAWLLREARVSAYRFTSLVDPFSLFSASVRAREEAFVIAPGADIAAYLEAVRAASPKKFKNFRRLDHKLGRDEGPLRIVAPDHDAVAFEQLIDWKRQQLARTGGHDFLAPAWTQGLLRGLFARREGDFRGLMISLYAGGRLVAGHFGVRLGGAYHPWIAAADPHLAVYSPGQAFLIRATAAMPDLGLASCDLGPTHEHYKRPYANLVRTVGEGLADAATARGRLAQGLESAWSIGGQGSGGLPARLHRRLDVISSVELDLPGRARGLAYALVSQARRRRASLGEMA